LNEADREILELLNQNRMDNCIGDLLSTISERSIDPRVSTGFSELDDILGGIPAGLHVVAAMSSLGKTTLVVQMCASMAQQGQDILFFTLEMSRLELFAKNISRHSFELDIRNHAQTGFSTNDIVSGYPERSGNQVLKAHLQKSVEAYRTYADRLTVIEGHGDITAARVRELTESYIRLTGRVPVVVIDYLQLLQPTDIHMTDKQNIDASIAELKRLTAQGCPVIAISSLNRASYDSPVTMASLKESGNIEYSSESILALDLQAMYDAQRQNAKGFDLNAEKQKPARAVLLTVLKNRNGRVGDQIPMLFYPKYNYFNA
jgi:replicative DNA helicase